MTTVMENAGTFADTGESREDRKAYFDTLVSVAGNTAVAVTYHQDNATGQDQFCQTD